MAGILSLASSAFGDSAELVAFRAREALGRPYEVELYLTMASADELDVADAAGSLATITLDRRGALELVTGGEVMRWSGMLLEVSIIAEHDARTYVRAVLVPKLYRAAQTSHTRVFTGDSLIDATRKVLEANGLRESEAWDIGGAKSNYPPEEHIAQWHESDLDFLHRWFEHEGLFYWFEQGEEAELLHIVDKNPSPNPLPIRFRATLGGDTSAASCFTRFRCDGRAQSGVVKVSDRDYAQPSLLLEKEGTVSEFAGEVLEHNARLIRSADVDRISKTRTETMKAETKVYRAEGNILGLSPGKQFHLEEHPRTAFGQDYLVTEAEHVGWSRTPDKQLIELFELPEPRGVGDLYTVKIVALEKDTPFRLQVRTAWPRIDGYETATIDGPAESDYAQLDDMGRYLVRFHVDESLGDDGKVSTWLRMMQPHTGAPEGMHFPLRKGTEVIVAFLGGDPDRPVILGAVPNGVTPSVITKSTHTKNRLFTGGGTTLEIEDQAGGQYVHWFTPIDHTHFHMGAPRKMEGKDAPPAANTASLGWSTDGNAVLSVGGEWDVSVNKKLHEIVKGPVVEEYKNTRTETVTGLVKETYDGPHELTVTGKQTVKIDTGKDDTIKSKWVQKISGGWHQKEITGGWTQDKIEGGWVQGSILGPWNQGSITQGWTQTSIKGGWTQTDIVGGWTQKVDSVDQHVTGKTKWDHDGGRKETLGGPGLEITAPKVKITAPVLETVNASWKQTNGDWFDVKKQKTTLQLLKIDITSPLSFAYTGIKIDLVSFKIANKGIHLERKEIEGGQMSCKVNVAGLTLFG